MSETTGIQYCDSTINPVMGCDGCELWQRAGQPAQEDEAVSVAKEPRRTCYAGQLHRTRGKTNPGFAKSFLTPEMFPGRTAKAARSAPLAGKDRADKPWLNGMPRVIFVSDMGDALSHEIPNAYLLKEIVEVAMGDAGKKHIWLWLSKRPGRMSKFSGWLAAQGIAWPRNVWAGTSVTGQQTIGRARSLLNVGNDKTIRFLSVEPQLGPIDLGDVVTKMNWVIQGGESGSRATPFDLGWARAMRDACRAAGVPYFLKQLGAEPYAENHSGCRIPLERAGKALRDRHGGDWAEWPEDLRVRQMPPFEPEPECASITVFEMMEQLCEADEEPGEERTPQEHHDVVENETPAHDAPSSNEPEAARELENQLEQVLLRLTGELSDLAIAKLLPNAKLLYETLHPEARHGGAKQVAKLASWPSFAVYLAQRTGISERTAYRRIEAGEVLQMLDAEAEGRAYGTRLANQLSLLVRIAAIPKAELHRDLVNVFVRSHKKGLAELCKWEDEFGLTKAKAAKPQDKEQADDAADHAADPGDAGADDADDVVDENRDHDGDDVVDESGTGAGHASPDANIATIIELLGVSGATDCVAAIQDLQTTAQQLRLQLQTAEGREAKLKAELGMYRNSQLGQLFAILGAKTAGQALAKARILKGRQDAA